MAERAVQAVWIAGFTADGARLAARLAESLTAQGCGAAAYAIPRHAAFSGLLPLEEPVGDWAGRAFGQADGIVFVSACGVAVRAVAPHLRGKDRDPAVVVLDDQGRYAVSLLSGHIGGANELARRVADAVGAVAVVTTATDGHGVFSADDWARRNGCAIAGLEVAKEISARLLDGGTVGFYSEFPVDGTLPDGVVPMERGELGISLSLREHPGPFDRTLALIPRILTVGVGCRRGTPSGRIEAQARAALRDAGLSPAAVERISSISLKADEAGLLEFCAARRLPLATYPPEELARAAGEFTPSAFVSSVTGVDNVCERAAVAGSGGGRLLVRKQAANGVTIAVAARNWRAKF